MNPDSIDLAVRVVLSRYPLPTRQVEIIPLGNHGGFSGARLWRVETGGGTWCLRAWQHDGPTPARLTRIHRLMLLGVNAGLDVIPTILCDREGYSWIENGGRLWEVTSWMPGTPRLCEQPTSQRLETACIMLARLHSAWARDTHGFGPCPGILRRLKKAREWIDLIQAGWCLPETEISDEVHPLAERAWQVIRRRVEQIPRQLAPWLERPVPIQPCLCDLRAEHLLFENEALAGLVDFGSIKDDHVAVDLARLLGSLPGGDGELRTRAFCAYGRVWPLSSAEEALVPLLDETGNLLGAANWLTWLYWEKRAYEDRAAVARRLEELVERLERGS